LRSARLAVERAHTGVGLVPDAEVLELAVDRATRTFRAYYRRSIDLAKSHNAVAANNKTKLALTYCLNLWIARASQWIVDTTTAAKLSVVYE
jgi:hypothetical protein